MSIITKKIKDEKCIACNGQKIICKHSFIRGKHSMKWEKCKTCNGTGRFVEAYSYYIDDKQGIAFGSEPGK